MSSNSKILSLQSLKKKIPGLRKKGKVIAFTNGCFDILHFGHVSYLQTAKKKDRVLIIGLNSDDSVRRLKGPDRPVQTQYHRAAVLAALECVDFVTIFNEDTPERLIKTLEPDILIKGADWKGKAIAGSDVVTARGGKVELIRYVPGLSTSRIVTTIRERG